MASQIWRLCSGRGEGPQTPLDATFIERRIPPPGELYKLLRSDREDREGRTVQGQVFCWLEEKHGLVPVSPPRLLVSGSVSGRPRPRGRCLVAVRRTLGRLRARPCLELAQDCFGELPAFAQTAHPGSSCRGTAQKVLHRVSGAGGAVVVQEHLALALGALAEGRVGQDAVHRFPQVRRPEAQLAEVDARAQRLHPVEVELLVVHRRDADDGDTVAQRLVDGAVAPLEDHHVGPLHQDAARGVVGDEDVVRQVV